MISANKLIFTGDFHFNKLNINDDLPAKGDNISAVFDVNDNLITMGNKNLTTNEDCSACSNFQIEHHECTTTSPIMRDPYVQTNVIMDISIRNKDFEFFKQWTHI